MRWKSNKIRVVLASYLVFLVIAELSPLLLKQLIHSLLLLFLIVYSSLPHREPGFGFTNLLRSLILLPLMRLLNTSMPLGAFEAVYWFMAVNAPLFIAAYLLVYAARLEKRSVGLVLGERKTQLGVGATGIVFGLMGSLLLEPGQLIGNPTLENLLVSMVILLVFTGFVEEFIFRGLIQTNAEATLGKTPGWVYASILFSVMGGLNAKSPLPFLFFLSMGLFYGYVFQRTRSLLGIALSHGIASGILFLLPLI